MAQTLDEVAGRGAAAAGVHVVARGLSHAYRGPDGPVPVLDDVDLDLAPGAYCALLGASGAGKTTLLALLGGLERVQAGRLHVGRVDLTTLGGDGLAAYRTRTVGFVFQHTGLLDAMSAAENVELAAMVAGEPRTRRRETALRLLGAVGMEHRASHRPAALSGGERQRVAIARAVANRPSVVLADEPTGNLDEASAAGVLDLLESVHTETGCTLVVVTHDRAVARRAPQRLVLTDGRVLAS